MFDSFIYRGFFFFHFTRMRLTATTSWVHIIYFIEEEWTAAHAKRLYGGAGVGWVNITNDVMIDTGERIEKRLADPQ